MSERTELHLPAILVEVRNRYPIDALASRFEAELCAAVGCWPLCSARSPGPLGLESGFFFLPVAQLIEWGIDDESVSTSLLELVYYTHLVYRTEDDAIDAGEVEPIRVLKAGVSRHRANEIVCSLVGADAVVDTFRMQRTAYERYAKAVLLEIQHKADPERRILAKEVLTLGDRAAPLVAVALTVCYLADRRRALDSLVEGVLRLCTALQLVDDLQDVVKDLIDGNPTWPAKSLRAAYANVDTWSAPQIHGAVEALGLRRSALKIAEIEARAAAESLSVIEAGVVSQWADSWAEQISQLRG